MEEEVCGRQGKAYSGLKEKARKRKIIER